ncbi:MAG: hypothetical protein JWO44_2299, partial [Bacteroidetes bacterium]|nr:hypothetical protein [Bacteroidota bacterium]
MFDKHIQFTSAAYKPHADHWKEKLSLCSRPFRFAGDKPKSSEKSNVKEHAFFIEAAQVEKFEKYVGGKELETFILLLSGINLLLHKYTGTQCIIITTPQYKNDLSEKIWQPEVSLIQVVNPEGSLKEHIVNTNATVTAAYKYQNFPYDVLTQAPLSDYKQFSNVLVQWDAIHDASAIANHINYDLVFMISSARPKEYRINIRFNGNEFSEAFVQQLSGHYITIMDGFNDLSVALNTLSILSPAERNYQLEELTATFQPVPAKTVLEVFSEQVASHGDSIAVIFKENKLSYSAL